MTNDVSQETSEAKQTSTADEDEAVRTMNARKGVRDQLGSDIEAFLAQGGSIKQVDNNVTADPPSMPVSRYGGRPI